MSSSLVVLIGAGALIAVVVFLAVWRTVPAAPLTSLLEQRLSSVPNAATYDIDLDTGEFTQPAFDRLVLPILSALGGVIAKRTKEGQLQQLRRLVSRSGSRQRAETLLALRLILPIACALVCLGLSLLADLVPPQNVLLVVVGVIAGYMYPTLSLERKAKRRQTEIRVALSGVLDLLTVCMEAGLSLDMAIMRVGDADESLLAHEFQKVLNEIRLGRPRGEALLAMAERNEVEELSEFCRAVVQAEPLGVSVVNVLRIQSEELRRKRKQRAEEAGHRAPVLMLMPMMGCIFPCVFIILLGPALVNLFFTSTG
ncbi:MAG: type II secretion system F family protein [Candidatus Dormibacteria bacterium]